MEKNLLAVIGSYNVGLFLKGSRIPGVGETVIGASFFEGGGGKGSNQAVACAKLGGNVRLVARLGTDKYGDDAMAMYRRFGMSTEGIVRDKTIHSGISVIFIDDRGSNSIMVVPGANFHLSQVDIDRSADKLADACLAGFQLENNLEIVDYGIRRFHRMGIKTLLDPAPATVLLEDLYPCIDYIKPNEHEAAILTGIPVNDAEDAARAGEWFRERGVGTAIITLGAMGAVVSTAEGTSHYPTPNLSTVDTTGAGDCFSGALMAALAGGASLADAVIRANCASALSVTKAGVIESLPTTQEVDALVRSFGEGIV